MPNSSVKPDFEQMQARADDACGVLKAMSNPCRLLILCQLLSSEQPVSVLIEAVGLSQSAVSQHLAKMRDEGLVSFERRGQEIFYRIDHPFVKDLLAVLYAHYCENAQERS